MWQDLAFELVVIPFDFEPNNLPPAGSSLFFGGPQMPNKLMQRILDKQRRDAPGDDWSNLEIGLRIRGYANVGEGIDWYVSHFYTRLDSPLLDEEQGRANFTRMALGLAPLGHMYTYPHYNSTAFSFTTTWSKIGSVIKGEATYNSNRDYNYGKPGMAYKIKEKDLITTAISIKRATMIPWISAWNRNRSFSLTFTYYQYWLLNHEYNKKTGEYIIGETGKDSSLSKFTFSASTGFWFDRIIPVVNVGYNENGGSTLMTMLQFMPGMHWMWAVTYQQFSNYDGPQKYQNQVMLMTRYEFW